MPSVNPKILVWARETAGLDLSTAAHKLQTSDNKLRALEAGEATPSRPMLEKMSKKFRRSLLTFYLEEPPRKADRGEDFRTLRDRSAVEFEPLIDAMVRDISSRQSLVRTTMEEDEEAPELHFVGSMKREQGLRAVQKRIVEAVQFNLDDFRRRSSTKDAFNYLRECAEHAGIFVLLVGDLGSHHTALPVESFRGFSIADKIAPFVVINSKDAEAARSFTLLHEIVHIFLGQTGLSGALAEKSVEKFCNDVGSEILLPDTELSELEIGQSFEASATLAVIAEFADARNISSSMVAYRLHKAGRLNEAEWKALEIKMVNQRENRPKTSNSETGPDYYVLRRHRLGNALLDFARRNLGAGTLSPVKTAKVLGVKPRAVYRLLEHGTSQ